MNEVFDFYIGQGDSLPILEQEVIGVTTLAGVDVTFTFYAVESGSIVKTRTASIVGDGSTHSVQYYWSDPDDTDTPGHHEGYFSLDDGSGHLLTAPNNRRISFFVTPKRT